MYPIITSLLPRYRCCCCFSCRRRHRRPTGKGTATTTRRRAAGAAAAAAVKGRLHIVRSLLRRVKKDTELDVLARDAVWVAAAVRV